MLERSENYGLTMISDAKDRRTFYSSRRVREYKLDHYFISCRKNQIQQFKKSPKRLLAYPAWTTVQQTGEKISIINSALRRRWKLLKASWNKFSKRLDPLHLSGSLQLWKIGIVISTAKIYHEATKTP